MVIVALQRPPRFATWRSLLYHKHMSYFLEVLRAMPRGLWKVDTTSTSYPDISGYGLTGSRSGTGATLSVPLVSGSLGGCLLQSTRIASFPSPVFGYGWESRNFTISAAFRTVSVSGGVGPQQVLGNNGLYDGICIDGTVVSFSTKYATTGEAKASYDMSTNQRVIAHGVHTPMKNSLYINGKLVAEVDITDAQKADTFIAGIDGNLYSGNSTGTTRMTVNAVATYDYALTPETIMRHNQAANMRSTPDEISNAFGGSYYPMTNTDSNIYVRKTWDTADDFNEGRLLGCTVQNDTLIPELDSTGTSFPAEWTAAFPIYGPTSIEDIVIDWEGSGITVQTSVSGTGYSPATRGRAVAGITSGYNPTGKVLFVRVNFSGNVAGDPAYLNSISIVGYLSPTINPSGDRTITLGSGVYCTPDPTSFLKDNVGAACYETGTRSISVSASSDGTVARTIEMLIKPFTTTAFTTTPAGTYYENGVSGADIPNLVGAAEWSLLHLVLTADSTTGFTLTCASSFEIAYITIYDTALSTTQISDIYTAFGGRAALAVADTSSITVSEPSSSATPYGYDWSIQAVG